jgi:UPF0271 protein
MTDTIDLNSDLGEGFGKYSLGDDAAMLDIVSSVNVACGFHAGDPDIMSRLAEKTLARGIALGAHPGFRDLHGFGRRPIRGIPDAELEHLIIYQVGALQGLARAVGQTVSHVRAHGALGNLCDSEPAFAEPLARAVHRLDSDLALMTLPGCASDIAASGLGLKVARQAFADRAYNDDGSLVSRALEGAVITDPHAAAERVVRLVHEGTVTTITGKVISLDARIVCVHGDSPAAAAMAESIRSRLENEGISIRPFCRHDDWR